MTRVLALLAVPYFRHECPFVAPDSIQLFSVLPLTNGMHTLLHSHGTLLNLGANANLSAPHPSENHIQIRIQMYGMHSHSYFLRPFLRRS